MVVLSDPNILKGFSTIGELLLNSANILTPSQVFDMLRMHENMLTDLATKNAILIDRIEQLEELSEKAKKLDEIMEKVEQFEELSSRLEEILERLEQKENELVA